MFQPRRRWRFIADLRYVVERLSDFNPPAERRLWLHVKHPPHNNERASDLIIADRAQEVGLP